MIFMGASGVQHGGHIAMDVCRDLVGKAACVFPVELRDRLLVPARRGSTDDGAEEARESERMESLY
jgi:hypothetical protein